MAAGTSSLESAKFAAGTGIINTARQVGSALGVAILVAIVGVSTVIDDFRGAWLAVSLGSLVAAATTLRFRPVEEPDVAA